ncbi:hypothetical protein CEXT_583371 [Caerostris extrusa]|uniref:Uncharacterized protein n=1 Tax=Caerostris extrusa TaxID=172846 RepID=A0AAV4UYE4_CAEEX|nr:hypothetical protein CEXT_583371 [Caerostris extrusa]
MGINPVPGRPFQESWLSGRQRILYELSGSHQLLLSNSENNRLNKLFFFFPLLPDWFLCSGFEWSSRFPGVLGA